MVLLLLLFVFNHFKVLVECKKKILVLLVGSFLSLDYSLYFKCYNLCVFHKHFQVTTVLRKDYIIKEIFYLVKGALKNIL